VAQFVRNPIFLSLNQDYWKKVLRWLSLPGMVAQFGAEYPSSAQNSNKEIVNLTQGDGLPSNECYFIFRDSKNFLWIATDQGVVRYSGTTITNYTLSDNIVFKIKEDEEGKVWFFTKSGKLSFFQNEKIYSYQYNDSIQKYCKNLLILNAFFTKDGGIHFNTIGKFNYDISRNGIIEKQYYQADEKGKRSLKFQISENSGEYLAIKLGDYPPIKDNFTSYIGIADSLHLQFKGILNDSVYRIPFNQTSFYQYGARKIKDGALFFNSRDLIKINNAGKYFIKNFKGNILSVKTDNKDNIWVGLVKGGVYKLDSNLNEIQPSLLKNKSISSIEFDSEGGGWFSTLESGVYYLKYSPVHQFKEDAILNETIFRIYNYQDSILFFANKSGVYKIENEKIIPVFKSEMINVSDLFIEAGDLFISAVGPEIPAFLKKEGNFKSGLRNIFIFSSAHEILKYYKSKYLVNFTSQLRLFNILNIPFKSYSNMPSVNDYISKFNKLFIDKERNVWGMASNGLYKLKSVEDSIGRLQEPLELFEKGVTCMGQLSNGYNVVGLRFGGIAVMQDTMVKLIIKKENGLVNNSVKCIYVHGMNVWVGTSNGISLISLDPPDVLKFHITNIEKSNGLSNAIIYQLTKFKDGILAATNKGILSVDEPELLLKRNVPVLPFYISNISWYKGDTSGISNITLPYNYSSLTVRYTCISFNSPEDVEYYYRVSNIDTSWKGILGKELVLQNLSPGTYKLEIKAALNNQRRYSEIRKITIYVEKPWWQYNLVRILFVALMLYLAFFIYRRREKKIRIKVQHENDTQMKMGALEQSALRSQMNPHFIFNCLTSIQQMIVSGKNTEANKYLVKFSRLIRSTLDLSSSAFISIADERNYLSDYIALEQLRLVEKIKFNFVIDDKINSEIYEIPSMILQPIIENSIRHGLKNLDKQGEIDISMVKEDGHLKCIITDNGHGLKELKSITEHKSHALQNISQRLQAIDELNNTHDTYFKVTNKVDDDGDVIGTMTIIKMPFKIKSK
jgi:ligand-binding sensor domain-containing protein